MSCVLTYTVRRQKVNTVFLGLRAPYCTNHREIEVPYEYKYYAPILFYKFLPKSNEKCRNDIDSGAGQNDLACTLRHQIYHILHAHRE